MLTFLLLAIIGLPWLGAVVIWGLGSHLKPTAQNTLATLAALGAGLATLGALPFASAQAVVPIPFGPPYGTFTFIPDGLGLVLAAIATLIGSLCLWFSRDYMPAQPQLRRYYALILIFIGAMVGLVLSGSLLFTFIFWEITALCSWALIAFDNDNPQAVAGGLKALLLTQLGGVGLLSGTLVVYAQLGTYDIPNFLASAATLPATARNFIAFAFLLAAAAKSAQFPFHTWLPAAMEAPTPVSALIHAATMVNAGVYLLARFYPAFHAVPGWATTVIGLGLCSLLLGALAATQATDLKRVLAYSTISQLGYLTYAVGTGALLASQVHLLSHALFKALLFLSAGAVIHALGTRDLGQMGGLSRPLPWVRNAFLVGAWGLVGLPPANGFFSKELLLEDALTHGPLWAYGLALLGVGLTAFYSTRTIWRVFFGPVRSVPHVVAMPTMRWVLGVLAVGVLTSALLTGLLSTLLARTLPQHALDPLSLAEMLVEIFTAWPTYLTLGVIGLGIGSWFARGQLAWLTALVQPLARWAAAGFGLEALNQGLVALLQSCAQSARRTQTGLLNWNIVGMVLGLAVLLALFAWEGAR